MNTAIETPAAAVIAAPRPRKTLRSEVPADILSFVFEYDTTFREIYSQAIFSREFAQSIWFLWKRKLFAEDVFRDEEFKGKCNVLLVYLARENILFEENTARIVLNITIYSKEKFFYFSNKQRNIQRAIELYNENPTIHPGKFIISIEYSDGSFNNLVFTVLTETQYFNRYVHVEQDRETDMHCIFSSKKYYILESMYDMFLPEDHAVI